MFDMYLLRVLSMLWCTFSLKEKALVFSLLEKKSGEFIGNIELTDVNNPPGGSQFSYCFFCPYPV